MSSVVSRVFSVPRILSSRNIANTEEDRVERRLGELQAIGERDPRQPSLFRP